MKSWYEIYRERMNQTYFEHVKRKYALFIHTIAGKKAPWYVELGCGAANITKAVQELDTRPFPETGFSVVDKCPQMLQLARVNLGDSAFYEETNIIGIMNRGYQKIGRALIHSHGVLEHFHDYVIRDLIKINAKCPQVHYVPSHRYETPSRGDERLLSREQWEYILHGVEGVNSTITEFNDGFDFMIEVNPA